MNRRTIALQFFIFAVQWGLMVLGFGVLAAEVAPTRLVPSSVPFERVFDALVKAVIAVLMSVFWLFVWDRQVRVFIYRKED